jgi:hypothetical protein
MKIIKEWKTSAGLKARIAQMQILAGHYCGYVGVTKKHPLFDKSYSQHLDTLMKYRDKIKEGTIGKRGIVPIACWDGETASMEVVFDVHGGITFAGLQEEKKNIYWIGFDCAHAGDTLEKCNIEYVTQECENLARQIKEVVEVTEAELKRSQTISIELEYAKNVLKVLDNHTSLCFAIVSQDIKDIVSDEAYDKLTELFMKYHNANCGPFNRHLKGLIEKEMTNDINETKKDQ